VATSGFGPGQDVKKGSKGGSVHHSAVVATCRAKSAPISKQHLEIARPTVDELDILKMMSAIGPKQSSLVAPHMSAFGDKADMTFRAEYVRL
jgi:hypothetical protein